MRRGSVSPRGKITKILLTAGAAACLAVLSSAAFAQDEDPPPQAGRLSIVNGTVSIQPAGSQDWGQAYVNYPVASGDRIFTDSDGRAEIEVGQTYVRVGPDSDLTFVDFSSQDITFGAAQGAVHIRTRGLWQGQSLYVQTPSGSATVTSPADFRVDVYPDQQSTIFTNYGGDVYVSGANDFGMDTQSGQSLELVGSNPVYPQWLQPAAADGLDQWSQGRDQQIARAASYRYVSSDAPGVEDLDSAGQWTPGTDYGDMWFPNVPAGWVPYQNGHWVNHEPWGWTWVEDEQWGYAPFHYGRWANYQGRWGWIPGPRAERAVWSPALVAFAGGIQFAGGAVSVWFPLGPGEPYRPWYPCSPSYINRVNISNIQPAREVHVQNTYVNITNVTNITYVNRTVGATAMRRQEFAAGRPVAQAAVRVDPQQMAHVQVLARPQVAPVPQATITRPPARPVPVKAARPILINAKGMAVAARPKAAPAPPPVMAAPQPPRLPNRVTVAPPPNAKMTPAARQAMQTSPSAHPGQLSAPTAPQPVQRQGQQPAAAPPLPNAQRPAPIPSTAPRPAPIPAPGAKPPAQPEQQNPARLPERTVPAPQTMQPPRTNERPAPQPPPPPRSTEHPAPPPPQETQPQRPVPRSEPEPPPPTSRQRERPTSPPEYHQQARPTAQPQPRPETRPEPQSPAYAAPSRPEQRPNAEPAPPAKQPAPPPDKNRKPDEKPKPEA